MLALAGLKLEDMMKQLALLMLLAATPAFAHAHYGIRSRRGRQGQVARACQADNSRKTWSRLSAAPADRRRRQDRAGAPAPWRQHHHPAAAGAEARRL